MSQPPPAAPSFMEDLKGKLISINSQYRANTKPFVDGLPTALLIIPLSMFLLSPTADRGMFLFGAVFTTLIGLLFTPAMGGADHFMSNHPSFHGIALGYMVGYLLMENVMLSKLGSMLSTIVMGIMLTVLLTINLFYDSVSKEILHVGLGVILGAIIGMFFCYAAFKALKPSSGTKDQSGGVSSCH